MDGAVELPGIPGGTDSAVVVRDRALGPRPVVLVGAGILVLPGVARRRVVTSVNGWLQAAT
jgi:hypothetical protein